jgi:hypothetical protein
MNTDIRDRQLAQNAVQMLGRTCPSDGAIAYNPRSFIVPCFPGIIQSVLQRGCNAVIVLCYNKDKPSSEFSFSNPITIIYLQV